MTLFADFSAVLSLGACHWPTVVELGQLGLGLWTAWRYCTWCRGRGRWERPAGSESLEKQQGCHRGCPSLGGGSCELSHGVQSISISFFSWSLKENGCLLILVDSTHNWWFGIQLDGDVIHLISTFDTVILIAFHQDPSKFSALCCIQPSERSGL